MTVVGLILQRTAGQTFVPYDGRAMVILRGIAT